MIDHVAIQLEENIPLTEEDIRRKEANLKAGKKYLPLILGVITLLVMAFGAFLIKDSWGQLKYYEYLLLVAGGFALYGFCLLIAQLVFWFDAAKWKKDKAWGKNRLTSTIIRRGKTEYGGEYLTFAGTNAKDEISIKVKRDDYSRFQLGEKVTVTYLKFSEEALELAAL